MSVSGATVCVVQRSPITATKPRASARSSIDVRPPNRSAATARRPRLIGPRSGGASAATASASITARRYAARWLAARASGCSCYPAAVPSGELIFANVLDVRQRAAEGDMANGLVYVLGLPARALPFVVIRDWKTPTGYLPEEVQLVAPSGDVVYRIGPAARYFFGSMDLTRFEDVVENAMFDQAGIHLASFVLDGEVLGQTEFQVVLQAA